MYRVVEAKIAAQPKMRSPISLTLRLSTRPPPPQHQHRYKSRIDTRTILTFSIRPRIFTNKQLHENPQGEITKTFLSRKVEVEVEVRG
jgi:hypothetical protein